MSNIAVLTRRIKKSAKKRTHEERIKLLKDAHIIDADGSVNKFFRTVTIETTLTVAIAFPSPKAR